MKGVSCLWDTPFCIISSKIRNGSTLKEDKNMKRRKSNGMRYLGTTTAMGICYFPLGVIFALAKNR